MRFFKFTFLLLIIMSVIAMPIYYFFFLPSTQPVDQLYELETPSHTNIKQIISANGKLKLKDQVKVGSLVTGRIKAIHVEENETVEEGQLLAEIDTGFADTEVREALGAYERALAELEFQEATLKRKKGLFEEWFLSDVDLQEAKRNYLTALADVKTLQATYERKLIEFENNRIYAPSSGVVIHIDMAKGEKVSADSDGETLLSLVPDIQNIEAELEISEKDIGQIKKGQEIQMIVDTYPNRTFKSTIHNVSFTANTDDDKECVYQATAYIDNQNFLLRPGMSVNATIDVASVESALTITTRAFLIKEEHLQAVSNQLNLSIQPLDPKEKQLLLEANEYDNIQFVWLMCEDCFKESAVKIGITDDISFEIKSGLNGDEKLVVDVMEDDEMQKIYDKFYRKL